MKNIASEITIEIMGRNYQVKCTEENRGALEQAARLLEEKMCYIRDMHKVISIDRIAVIAALNMANQLINIENKTQVKEHHAESRLRDLQSKVEGALARHSQMELASAE